MGRKPWRQHTAGILSNAPAFLLILGLIVYPVGYSIWLSLLEKHSFFSEQRFIESFFWPFLFP